MTVAATNPVLDQLLDPAALAILAVLAVCTLLVRIWRASREPKSHHSSPYDMPATPLGVLYGRDSELVSLTGHATGLIVIYGDPGAGKSELLRHSSYGARVSALAGEPVRVGRTAGALQAALIESLSTALADAMEQEGAAKRWSRTLASAIENLTAQRVGELTDAIGGLVFDMIADRLGESGGELARDLRDSVSRSASESLDHRIKQAVSPDVLDIFRALASELHTLSGRPLALSIDACEVLPDEDFRQLLSLAETPTAGVSIRAALATASGVESSRVLELKMAGASEMELPGLQPSAVEEWLRAKALPVHHLGHLLRATDGLPLYVDAAIGHLQAGGRIRELPVRDNFVEQTKDLLRRLDAKQQQAVVLLCAFTDPPPTSYVQGELRCTELEWSVIEAELIRQRAFATTVGDHAWFHEVRRRAFWEHALNPPQRRLSAETALQWLIPQLEEGPATYERCADLVTMFEHVPSAVANFQNLDQVMSLGDEELKLLAAFIELGEQQRQHVVEVNSALAHARTAFGSRGDALTYLSNLQECGLLTIAQDEHQALGVPVWGSQVARAAAFGRIVRTLNRTVIPSIASALFDELFRPALGPFAISSYGLGSPGLVSMSESLREMDYEREGDKVTIHRRYGVMIRGALGDVATHAVVSFDDQEGRDRALSLLPDVKDEYSFGARFSVESVHPWPHPSAPLRSNRFLRAVELLSGVDLGHGSSNKRVTAISTESLEDELIAVKQLDAVMRGRTEALERSAMNLDRSRGYAFYEMNGSQAICTLYGTEQVLEIAPPDGRPFGPLYATSIALATGLEGVSVGRMTYRSGRSDKDPLAERLQDHAKSVSAFNKAQRYPRKELLLEQDILRRELLAAMELRTDDAIALRDSGLIVDKGTSLYRTTFLSIHATRGRTDLLEGMEHSLSEMSFVNDSENVLHLVFYAQEDGGWLQPEDLEARFGVTAPDSEPISSSQSVLQMGIERRLGYDPLGSGGLWFRWPDLPEEE